MFSNKKLSKFSITIDNKKEYLILKQNEQEMVKIAQKLRKEFQGIELFAFDGDGVIYRGAELLPGAKEALTFLNDNFKVVIVTNNSTSTTDTRRLKLEKLGIELSNDQIISSASATATYLVKTRPDAKKVWVIGEQGLRDELAKKGFIILNEELGELEENQDIEQWSSCTFFY